MATNFEFYKDEISEITREGQRLAIVEGKLRGCIGVDCDDCYFGYGCMQKTFEWLYAEHIEQPNLTKRERAFCEAVQTGWFAKCKSGALFWHHGRPTKKDSAWYGDGISNYIHPYWCKFEFMKWEDENPWSVEDLLKLEVKE